MSRLNGKGLFGTKTLVYFGRIKWQKGSVAAGRGKGNTLHSGGLTLGGRGHPVQMDVQALLKRAH